ncbi:putative sialin (solute carrier family 17 member 5) (sodium/sialic acid cotransporter) (ast) (membrane glycoprotein hp59) [Schistosoma mansoni]|uniref:putative sialin (solute carrier family 17 member 5) (sodium/sialic acid cotransporter) (ast) (membrane glycoprotein hp59) n=1 Tax=Schistosoma mansoni TaxID=6183 RepID=UPI00022DC845|nr:putative sialin (solute carrier family 17 member 5) (sodium/sialic acid cotransporter) (ast) (membrane glycoprotein hp59) [Schistosoma mansoni]|eukprot:XP_018652682.1 putative sialin (solute carrier family 17 member 5) (sodium/sialic acid cotransporter) (ast) (membrane glycoprotein hp59) [Schistosoma mansoni]
MSCVTKVFCCKCRYVIATMGFINLILIYMMRVDLNVTMLAMVNDTVDKTSTNHTSFFCSDFYNYTSLTNTEVYFIKSDNTSMQINAGEFNWNRLTQGLILGAFFWGYILTQIPARIRAELLITLRVIQGLLQGVVMPNTGCLVGNWSPPSEKSRFTTFVFSGLVIGAVIGQSLAGVISQPRLVHSTDLTTPTYISYWPYVHYIYGIIAVVFSGIWTVLVFNSPNQHPWISSSEKQYILSTSVHNNSENDNKSVIPWGQIFKSAPVWSILICHVCFNWSFYSLITSMPTYMCRVLGFSMTENGLLSSIPYIAQSIVSLLAAYLSDFLIAKHFLSTTSVRKLNNVIALGGLGLGLISVSLVGCNRMAAIVLFSVTIGLMGFSLSGYGSNALDLAPIYNGNIISVTNTAATLPGIFGPLVIGYVTRNSSSIHNWMIVFGIAAGIAWFGALMNLWLTSGEIQPWSRLIYIKTNNNNPLNRQSSITTGNTSPKFQNIVTNETENH